MANANIFAQYLQAPQSVTSKIAALDQADFQRAQMEGAVRQNRLQELTFQRGEQDRAKALARESSLRAAAIGAGGDEAKYATALRGMGEFDLASGIEKAIADRVSTQATTEKARADTKAKTWEQSQKERETAVRDIAMFNTPEDAIADVRAKLQAGTLDMRQASAVIKTIETNPNWQLDLIRGILTPKDRLEADMKGRTEARQAANELLVIDPATGKWVENKPLVSARSTVGKASAATTNVKVDAKLGEGVAKEVGPMMASSLESANGARNQLQTANQIVDAVDSGRVIAGPGASWRLSAKQMAQTFGVGGKDDAEIIANTRQAIQGLAQSTVNARKQVAGQGSLSDNEQALLQRATSGNIDEMTAPEIKQIAQLNMRLSRQVIQQHNKRLEKLKANPATKDMADFYEAIPLDEDPVAPTQKPAQAKPAKKTQGGATVSNWGQ